MPQRDLASFEQVLKEKYPEINLEVVPYSGQNSSAYLKNCLRTGNTTDIFFTTYYTPGYEGVSENLLDLSGYDFTNNYTDARLRELMDDGALYLLPAYYNCYGITYNKKILEDNGWELPKNLDEMAELKEKAEAAGYNFALTQLQYPGYGFQYLCNIADTDYLSTLGGRQWQRAFLKGETTLADSPEMLDCFRVVNRWRDLGLLSAKGDPEHLDVTRDIMAEGNTLFMLGNSNEFVIYGEDVASQFALMPYLSENGGQNVYILNVAVYFGMNKRLAEPGNEQKLEDALHVMEVLSTVEGMQALFSNVKNIAMLSLKNAPTSDSYFFQDPEVLDALNAGYTAPFIYAGWENMIVSVGEKMLDFIKGDCEIDDVIRYFDEAQTLITDNQIETFTTVTERMSTEECARIIGIALGSAVDADGALISLNKYFGIPGDGDLNQQGVSGELFALPVTDQEITAILPTGWTNNVKTVTLTGARIKELAEQGFDLNGAGVCYPYVLEMRGNAELQDDQTYTMVICGVNDEVAAEGSLTDTGVLGLDAMKNYFRQFETYSKQDIHWD